MTRFTLSHHAGSKEPDHYDLMLEKGDALRTWRLKNILFQVPQEALQIKDHRKEYLDFEGEVSGKRGRVAIWDTGTYAVDEWTDRRIRVALAGRQIRARLRLDLAEDPRWTAVDAGNEVRKSVSAFLRNSGLEDPPDEELAPLRAALLREERKILAQADRFVHGQEVNWDLVEADEALHERIASEGARWRHPWLTASRAYAEKLEGLVTLLQGGRPI